MNFKLLRLIAGAVLFTFIASGMNPVAYANASMPQSIGVRAELPVSPFKMIEIPAELGQVTDMITGDPSAPAFIHIQSAHGSYEAEKNIEKLLGHIEKNSSVRLMLLEGAANKLQPELFRIFSDHPDFNRKVVDKLMQEGFLTGPESFLINCMPYNNMSVEAFGIEDLEAYKKDRDAFISVVKEEKNAERFLGSQRAAIEKSFAAKLNKELLRLARQEEAFDSGTVSFEGWLKVLGEASKRHLKTDLSDAFYQGQYPFLIRYFRLQKIGSKIDRAKARQEAKSFLNELTRLKTSGEILGNFKALLQLPETDLLKNVSRTADGYSTLRRAFDLAFEKLPKDFSMDPWSSWTLYAQYIILMQEMEGKGLHEETSRLKDKIQNVLAKTLDEKEYLAVARKLYLLRRLFSLELTRAEYEELKTQRDSQLETRTSQGTKTSLEPLVPRPEAKALFVAAMAFYQTAIIREQHMFTNALARMEKQKQNRAVIVTGGFHAEGLKKLAASKNCSYLQITPHINEVSKRDHEIYLRSIFGSFDSAQDKSRDFETSQMDKVSGIDRPAMQHVLGEKGAEAVVRAELRIIRDMINSEAISDRPMLSSALSRFFLTPVSTRAEVRTVGKLFYPTVDLQKLIQKTNGQDSSDRVRQLLDEAEAQGLDLWIRLPLRGLDGPGSSLDLPRFQLLLTKKGAKNLSEVTSTPTLASNFYVTVRIKRAANPNAVEYVAPDYGIPAEKPHVIVGDVKLENGTTSQKNGPQYIFSNLFKIRGVRIELEEMPVIAMAGGMESSNAFNVAVLAAASMLSGINLSWADIFQVAVELENKTFKGLTGGQGHVSSILGGAMLNVWISGIKDAFGETINPYGAFSVPFLGEEGIQFVEKRMALVQAGKKYKDGKPMVNRTAALINNMWTDLLEDGDPVGFFLHSQKLVLAQRYVEALSRKEMKTVIETVNAYVDIRDALQRRWLRLAMHPENAIEMTQQEITELGIEKTAFDGAQLRANAEKYARGLVTDEVLRQYHAKFGEKLAEISLYTQSLDPESVEDGRRLIDAARKREIAIMPLGAGGPSANMIAIAENEEDIEKFFAEYGISVFDEIEARKIVRGEVSGEHTLRGYLPLKVGREGVSFNGLDHLTNVQRPEEPVQTVYESGKDVTTLTQRAEVRGQKTGEIESETDVPVTNEPPKGVAVRSKDVETPSPEVRRASIDEQKKQAVFSASSSVYRSGFLTSSKGHRRGASFKLALKTIAIAAMMGLSAFLARAAESSHFIPADGPLFSNVETVENFSTLLGLTEQNFDLNQTLETSNWMFAPSNPDFKVATRIEGSEIVAMVLDLRSGVQVDIMRIPDTSRYGAIVDVSPRGTVATILFGVEDANGFYTTYMMNEYGQTIKFPDLRLRSLSFNGPVATAFIQAGGILETATFGIYPLQVFSETPEGWMITPSNPDFVVGAVLVPGNPNTARVVLFQISKKEIYTLGDIPISWRLQDSSDFYTSEQVAGVVLGARDANGVNTIYAETSLGKLISFNGFFIFDPPGSFDGQRIVNIPVAEYNDLLKITFTKIVRVDLLEGSIDSTFYDVPPGWKAAPSNPDGFAIGKVTVGSEEMLVALDRTTGELIKIATIPEGSSAQSFSDILSNGDIVVYGIGDTIYVQKLRDASSRVTFSGNVQSVELNGQTLTVRALHNNAFWKTVTVNLNPLQIISTLFDVPSGWTAAPSNPNGFAIGEMASGSQKTLTALARDTGELIPIAVIPSGSSAQSFSDISSDGTLVVYGIGNNGYVQKLRTSSSRVAFIGNIQSDSFSEQTVAVMALHHNRYPKTVTVDRSTMTINSEVFDDLLDGLTVKGMSYFTLGVGKDPVSHYAYDHVRANGNYKSPYSQLTLIGFDLQIHGDVILGELSNGMTQTEALTEIDMILTNLLHDQATLGWNGLLPSFLGLTSSGRTSDGLIGCGDNLNLSQSMEVLIGALESAGDLGAKGASVLTKAAAFLAAQEDGYALFVDPVTGLFFGIYDKMGKTFSPSDARLNALSPNRAKSLLRGLSGVRRFSNSKTANGGFSTTYYLDRKLNEFAGGVAATRVRFPAKVPSSVWDNLLLVTDSTYIDRNGQIVTNGKPWGGAFFQMFWRQLRNDESRYPRLNILLYNFLASSLDFAYRNNLLSPPNAVWMPEDFYMGDSGNPWLAEQNSSAVDNRLIFDVGALRVLATAKFLAPAAVSNWMKKASSVFGTNDPYGVPDSARSSIVYSKIDCGIDVGAMVLGFGGNGPANYDVYLRNRGLTAAFDQLYKDLDALLDGISRTTTPLAAPPDSPDRSLAVFAKKTSEGDIAGFSSALTAAYGIKFQTMTTKAGGHFWKFSRYNARANRLAISYSTVSLPAPFRIEFKKNGSVVYRVDDIIPTTAVDYGRIVINLPDDAVLDGIDEMNIIMEGSGVVNCAFHSISFQHFSSESIETKMKALDQKLNAKPWPGSSASKKAKNRLPKIMVPTMSVRSNQPWLRRHVRSEIRADVQTAQDSVGESVIKLMENILPINLEPEACAAELLLLFPRHSDTLSALSSVNVAAAQQIFGIQVPATENGHVLVVTPGVIEMGLLPALRTVYQSSGIFVLGADSVQERLIEQMNAKMSAWMFDAVEPVKNPRALQEAIAKRKSKIGVSEMVVSGFSTTNDLSFVEALKKQVPDIIFITDSTFGRFFPHANEFIQGLMTEFQAALRRARSA